MEFKSRLLSLCKEKEITRRQLEIGAGLSNGQISKWLKDNGTNPNLKSQEKIAKYFGVSVDYLMGRTDEKNANANYVLSLENKLSYSTPYVRFALLLETTKKELTAVAHDTKIPLNVFIDWKLGKSVPTRKELEKIADYFEIDVNWIADGSEVRIKQFENTNVLKWSELENIGNDELFYIECNDNSMSQRIEKGDILTIQKQSFAENRQIIIAKYNNVFLCRQFIKFNDGIMLLALNGAYDPIYLSDEKQIEIIGKIIAIYRNI